MFPAAIRTRSLAAGTRAGDHVDGSDHAPDRALEIVGLAHRSGIPAGTLCAVASVAHTINEQTIATQPSGARLRIGVLRVIRTHVSRRARRAPKNKASACGA